MIIDYDSPFFEPYVLLYCKSLHYKKLLLLYLNSANIVSFLHSSQI